MESSNALMNEIMYLSRILSDPNFFAIILCPGILVAVKSRHWDTRVPQLSRKRR